ncbi:MAG: chorismate synthase [Cryomorphaceae bacterium]|nr:chorismate synthase [Cryomorphaceae bacterium]
MAGSTFGTLFQLSTFGESHGAALGGVIQGCPPNLAIDFEYIQAALNRRRPGQSALVSPRNEADEVEFLSGIYQGKTTGTPIGFILRNHDQRPEDYEQLKAAYRPSHADYTYDQKYGHRDPRGGGRSSARETACRVVAGAIAEHILAQLGIQFSTYVDQIGPCRFNSTAFFSTADIDQSFVRCPDQPSSREMIALIEETKEEGDTLGGAIRGIIHGVPAGLGEPVFDKLHAELGKAMLSINAVKGVEFGSGFDAIGMKGSAHNDVFTEGFNTETNHSGGIQGGISNGMPITFRVAFKPVATLMQTQRTVNAQGEAIALEARGRHDVCVVPRAVPIVQAMAALVILDAYLLNKRLSL